MNLYRYCVLLILLAIQFTYSKSVPSSTKDQSALKKLLLSKDENLFKYSSSILEYHDAIVLGTVPLFSAYSFSITLDDNDEDLIFEYISLNSKDFFIKNMLKTFHHYSSPHTLEILFSPSVIGIRSDYMILCTSSKIIVIYLQGTGEESKYRLKTINIDYYAGQYGFYEVSIFNPSNEPLGALEMSTISKELSISNNKEIIKPNSAGKLGIITAFYSKSGEYRSCIKISIRKKIFYVPIKINVLTSGLEIPKTLNFGILTVKGFEYPLEIIGKNSAMDNIKILKITSLSKLLKISYSNTDLAYSERKKIADLSLTPTKEGFFSSKIEVFTNENRYIIDCIASIIYSLIEISNYHLSYNPEGQNIYDIDIYTSIQNNIYIDSVSSSSSNFGVSIISKLSANEKNTFQVAINSKVRSIQFITFNTNLCTIQIPIIIEDPVIKFSYLENGIYLDLYGPIDFGYIAYNSRLSLSIAISNPNYFEVVIDLIESIPQTKIEMPKRVIIPPLGFLSFSIAIKADRSLFNPIIFHTSIGSFFIALSLDVVSGIGKINPIHLGEVTPGISKEQLIYFTNNFPVPLTIHSISSPVSFLNAEITSQIVLPNTEQVIGKVRILYGGNDKIQLDWDKSLTYGDTLAWEQLTNH